jgi:hypothetical protein
VETKTHRKETDMTTTTIEEQLAEVGRTIDKLQKRARSGPAEAKPRIQRHVNALRREEAEVQAAFRKASDDAEEQLAQLRMRVHVAERAVDTEHSRDRDAFPQAVEEELRGWDGYLERLQASAAGKAGAARVQAEAAIAELRRYRMAVTGQLTKLRDASTAHWSDQRARIDVARDQLEQRADALAAKLRR